MCRDVTRVGIAPCSKSWRHSPKRTPPIMDLRESSSTSSYVQLESLSLFNVETPNVLASPPLDLLIGVIRCGPHLPYSLATPLPICTNETLGGSLISECVRNVTSDDGAVRRNRSSYSVGDCGTC